jgi:SAM-dependent methyltransferase
MAHDDHAHEPAAAGRMRETYEAYAAQPGKRRAWSATNPGNRAIRAEVVAAITPWIPPHGRILDAGCGSGWFLAELAGHGVATRRLAGVDVLGERTRAAAVRAPGADVHTADVRALPFEDGSFALVLLLTVLSSLDATGAAPAALREVRRVLASGGTAIVWEPRWSNPRNRATTLVRRRDVENVLGGAVSSESITLVPALARRLGGAAAALYAPAVGIPLLRSHRLMVLRPRSRGAPADSSA